MIDNMILLNKINNNTNKKLTILIFTYIIKNNIEYIKTNNNIYFDLNKLNDDDLIYIYNLFLNNDDKKDIIY